MSNYSNRLSASDAAVKAEQITLAEANAKAQVEQEISRLTAQAATLQAAYNAALGANPFNLSKVLAISKEQADNKAASEFAAGILASEFSN